MRLFDTHAHYDDARFDEDRDAVLADMAAHGVQRIVQPSCHMASCRRSLELADRWPFIHAAVGVHPHDAKEMTDADLDTLRQWARQENVVAIGEIGLDYFHNLSPRETQLTRLRQLMELAEEVRLPVIFHDRDAHEDSMNVVRDFPRVTGVFHCYSGSLEMAKELVRRGWHLSFTGAVTFRNARRALEVAAWLPDDRILLETDAPYLTPEPHRGKRNDSRYLPLIAQALAAVRGATAEALAELTLHNGEEFFNL